MLGLAGILVAVAGAFTAWRLTVHNEGVVEPGALYRSAQLKSAALEKEIKARHIRTVINLRGENDRLSWYRQEVEICRRLGVLHLDVALSARSLPDPKNLLRLLEFYQTAPRPILLHCRSGSDRTGLAVALFEIDQQHLPWQQAKTGLSWHYGHFALYPYFEMDEFVELYGQSGASSLTEWAQKDYPAVYAREMQESRRHEMLEPLEFLLTGRP